MPWVLGCDHVSGSILRPQNLPPPPPIHVTQVTALFLVEYLGINWTEGLRWYHDTLVDADLAINSMMWQNAGGSGLDHWNFSIHPGPTKCHHMSE